MCGRDKGEKAACFIDEFVVAELGVAKLLAVDSVVLVWHNGFRLRVEVFLERNAHLCEIVCLFIEIDGVFH